MTVTLHSRNNDINNRVSPQLEDDSRNQDRFESQMTNKFGQTLAKISPTTPLSPTLEDDPYSPNSNQQPIPLLTYMNIQKSVSPLNFNGESKTKFPGPGCYFPPLTDSIHSFYKDTTFNSFKHIQN